MVDDVVFYKIVVVDNRGIKILVCRIFRKRSTSELNILVEQIPKVMKTEFVSLADRLRQEGREEGVEKGIERGIIKERERKNRVATENMLRKGFEVSIICDVLDVAPAFVEEVRKTMTQ